MCNQINTDVMLANLFAQNSTYPSAYSFGQIDDYFSFLVASWPCYLVSDFSKVAIRRCAQQHPELYQLCKMPNGDSGLQSGRLVPSLKFWNALYPKDVAKYIEEISKYYVENLGGVQ